MSDISHIIPQCPPFVFVDEVAYADEEGAEVYYTITKECPLVDDDRLPLAGVLEHVAQSCAARIGNLQITKNEPVRIGYIGAVKTLALKRMPKVGERMRTKVMLMESVLDISLLQCDTFIEGECIAQTTLKLALM